MPYHWENRERMRTGIRSAGLGGHVCFFIGVVFAIIGIVAGAIDAPVGLAATHWFLLAIVALVVGVIFFIGWALGWYLKTTESKKKE